MPTRRHWWDVFAVHWLNLALCTTSAVIMTSSLLPDMGQFFATFSNAKIVHLTSCFPKIHYTMIITAERTRDMILAVTGPFVVLLWLTPHNFTCQWKLRPCRQWVKFLSICLKYLAKPHHRLVLYINFGLVFTPNIQLFNPLTTAILRY